MKQSTRIQQGFTLIEIAIVLVIIGLLLGGVLKGQEMIENAKAKNAINDLNGVSAAYNSYRDRYRALPGDDGPVATFTARGWPATVLPGAGATGQNGVINVTGPQTFNGLGENGPFWQQLKQAGYINGNPAQQVAAALPKNAFGGVSGVTNAAVLGYTAPTLLVCMSNVPGKAATAIDNALDDSNPQTGNVRGSLQAGTGPTAPTAGIALTTAYNENSSYTLCRTL